ncbi:MAG: aminoglycoside adenylyltransferase domain-containing protein [Pseudonocardiaceae bacterium]
MQRAVERLSQHLETQDPGGVLGLYLFGSWVAGGLHPDSDIDLLMLTDRSLSLAERRGLVELLLQFSGRRATVEPGRPLELTSLVLDDVVPWTYPPVCDLLYGEWLREEFGDGRVPERHVNPDLAVLLTTVQQHVESVRGPNPAELLEQVPTQDLYRSMLDGLAPLLRELVGDERNVLLTLARMVVTFDTGRVVSKAEAARQVMSSLQEPRRSVMTLALGGYLGELSDDWSQCQVEAKSTAQYLAERIRDSGEVVGSP